MNKKNISKQGVKKTTTPKVAFPKVTFPKVERQKVTFPKIAFPKIAFLKVVFLIVGTLIGAGFASGREIYLFFNIYGRNGLIGIVISSLLTGVIIKKVLEKSNMRYSNKALEGNVKSYYKLLESQNKKHPKINKIIITIVNSFLLISYFIMIAGFSAFLKQTCGINTYISSIIFSIFCTIIFLKNIEGVMKVNSILVPIIIILISYLGMKNMNYIVQTLSQTATQIMPQNTPQTIQQMIPAISNLSHIGWLINAILYASYNSIILIPVLANVTIIENTNIYQTNEKKIQHTNIHKTNSKKIENENLHQMNHKYIENTKKRQINTISILSTIIIIILSLFIYGLILRGINYASELELPLLVITNEFGNIFKYMYGIVIVISIFTSAISAGYSFLQNTSKNKKQYIFYLIIINIIGIMVSNIGFTNLVNTLYPFFGILGLLQIILILK